MIESNYAINDESIYKNIEKLQFVAPSQSKYSRISHDQRLNIIYSKTILDMTLHEISEATGINYNSVRNILKNYNDDGRTNRKIYK